MLSGTGHADYGLPLQELSWIQAGYQQRWVHYGNQNFSLFGGKAKFA